jgi:oligogalacturonide lyase
MSLANIVGSRRLFLAAIPGICAAASTGRGTLLPSAVFRYSDPTTDFPVFRLTNPEVRSVLPPHYGRAVSRKGNFLVYASDASGSMQAWRMDLKSGEARQLTDAENFDPACFTLLSDEKSLCYVDGGRVHAGSFAALKPRQVYQAPEGYRLTALSVADDGLFAGVVERKGSHYRLQSIRMADGSAATLAEADEEFNDPVPRPRRASILYRRSGGLWLANLDGKQNYRLRLADGQAEEAIWSPEGRTVLYLNVPADSRKLRNIREFTPDTNEDKAVSDTTQYACFARNADASVFVGASRSLASPHVFLLVRAVKREFTLCEHRSSDPAAVLPIFSPNSQNIFFTSDRHGKLAIYRIAVEKLVEQTDDSPSVNERR